MGTIVESYKGTIVGCYKYKGTHFEVLHTADYRPALSLQAVTMGSNEKLER